MDIVDAETKWNEAGSKPITYRLEFLKCFDKSSCSPPPTPGIHEGSQRQTESAKKPACRSFKKHTSKKFTRCRLLPAIGSLAVSRMITDLINAHSQGLN